MCPIYVATSLPRWSVPKVASLVTRAPLPSPLPYAKLSPPHIKIVAPDHRCAFLEGNV